MNYRLIHNTKTKGRFNLLPPLFFIGVVVLFYFFYPTALEDLALRIASPLWSAERFTGEKIRIALLFFSSKHALTEDVKNLSEELDEANRQLANKVLLQEENRILKEQLGFSQTQSKRILGTILATPPHSPYDTVVVSAGEKDGVIVGDLAISGSFVLGMVGKAGHTTSVLELFSTPGKKTQVSILHDGKPIPAEAVGDGGGAFTAKLPKEVELRVGDPITMPPFNLLMFAEITALESSDTDSFQKIRFKNPVALQALRFLEIRHPETEISP